MDVPHDGTQEGTVARGDVWGNIGCLPPLHLVFSLECAAHDGEHSAREQVADTMIKARTDMLRGVIRHMAATNKIIVDKA